MIYEVERVVSSKAGPQTDKKNKREEGIELVVVTYCSDGSQ